MIDITFDSPDDTHGPFRSYILTTKRIFSDRLPVFYRIQFTADPSDWTPTVERMVEKLITSITFIEGYSPTT